jgi:hypothetical protein
MRSTGHNLACSWNLRWWADLRDWAFNLWCLMLSQGRCYQNSFELEDIQVLSAGEYTLQTCLLWGRDPHIPQKCSVLGEHSRGNKVWLVFFPPMSLHLLAHSNLWCPRLLEPAEESAYSSTKQPDPKEATCMKYLPSLLGPSNTWGPEVETTQLTGDV